MKLMGFAMVVVSFVPAAPSAPASRVAGPSVVDIELRDASLGVRPGRVPVGPVLFRIANKSKVARTFAVGGVRTGMILAHTSRNLRAELRTRGPKALVSIGRGRAARLTGVLNAFVPCPRPSVTSVGVKMDHDRSGITLSRSTIPCGTVTFVVTNIGVVPDSLQVLTDYPHPGATTPVLAPGETVHLTVRFPEKGIAYYMSGNYPPGEPEFGGSDADGGSIPIV